MDNVNIKHAIETNKSASYSLFLPPDATDPSIVPVTAAIEAVLLPLGLRVRQGGAEVVGSRVLFKTCEMQLNN